MQSKTVVPFKNNEGISFELTQRLLKKGKPYGLTAIFPFNIEQLVVAEWVHLK